MLDSHLLRGVRHPSSSFNSTDLGTQSWRSTTLFREPRADSCSGGCPSSTYFCDTLWESGSVRHSSPPAVISPGNRNKRQKASVSLRPLSLHDVLVGERQGAVARHSFHNQTDQRIREGIRR